MKTVTISLRDMVRFPFFVESYVSGKLKAEGMQFLEGSTSDFPGYLKPPFDVWRNFKDELVVRQWEDGERP